MRPLVSWVTLVAMAHDHFPQVHPGRDAVCQTNSGKFSVPSKQCRHQVLHGDYWVRDKDFCTHNIYTITVVTLEIDSFEVHLEVGFHVLVLVLFQEVQENDKEKQIFGHEPSLG